MEESEAAVTEHQKEPWIRWSRVAASFQVLENVSSCLANQVHEAEHVQCCGFRGDGWAMGISKVGPFGKCAILGRQANGGLESWLRLELGNWGWGLGSGVVGEGWLLEFLLGLVVGVGGSEVGTKFWRDSIEKCLMTSPSATQN